jgi:hypothetical protein
MHQKHPAPKVIIFIGYKRRLKSHQQTNKQIFLNQLSDRILIKLIFWITVLSITNVLNFLKKLSKELALTKIINFFNLSRNNDEKDFSLALTRIGH